ncbi:hypothetical protein GLGCALEP_02397 [Pseudomonas sp. MM221]|nr:hypothetical protein DBADOPDK_02338 [Pseudomonas sp. MM223]CAI3800076.1 hypothetical protein GLGCALEP_02397 [Pseudomonas sp. MM221]
MYFRDVFSRCQRYDASTACNLIVVARRPLPMTEKVENVSEAELDALEEQVPQQAVKATHHAYLQALKISPCGVVCVEDGKLVRTLANGTKATVGLAKPRRKVNLGHPVAVRKANQAPTDEGA